MTVFTPSPRASIHSNQTVPPTLIGSFEKSLGMVSQVWSHQSKPAMLFHTVLLICWRRFLYNLSETAFSPKITPWLEANTHKDRLIME
jgi:hypothetical protein